MYIHKRQHQSLKNTPSSLVHWTSPKHEKMFQKTDAFGSEEEGISPRNASTFWNNISCLDFDVPI